MIHHGDCLDVMRTMEPESVDAIVSDPPYGLAFMGKQWDHGVPGEQFWREALRVAKPGAHLVAFGGTRTFHRLACAIEDAGWEIRDCLSWLYGSGFPKSLDVSKAMDKAAGAEREVVGRVTKARSVAGSSALPTMGAGVQYRTWDITAPATDIARQWAGWGTALKPAHEPIILARKPLSLQDDLAILAPTTKEELWRVGSYAKTDTPLYGWLHASGFWSIGGLLSNTLDALSEHASKFTTETAFALTTDLRILKSSLSKITPDTITEAASQISGAESNVWLAAAISRSVLAKCERLGFTTADALAISSLADEGSAPGGGEFSPAWEPIILARKPLIGTVAANVAAHGTGGLNIDGCRIALDADADASQLRTMKRSRREGGDGWGMSTVEGDTPQVVRPEGRWPANVVLDEEAARMLDEQSGERKVGNPNGITGGSGGIWNDGDTKPVGPVYGDTGGASRFFYCAKASRSEREAGLEDCDKTPPRKEYGQAEESGRTVATPDGGTTVRGKTHIPRTNHHPTVKPIALMRWLCRLVTPPNGLILDPFTGSGTTGCAAAMEGFRFVGIEKEAEYVEIAEKRITHWQAIHQPDLV